MNGHEYLIPSYVSFVSIVTLLQIQFTVKLRVGIYNRLTKKTFVFHQISASGRSTYTTRWMILCQTFLSAPLPPPLRKAWYLGYIARDLVHVHCWLTKLSKRYTVSSFAFYKIDFPQTCALRVIVVLIYLLYNTGNIHFQSQSRPATYRWWIEKKNASHLRSSAPCPSL